MEIFQLYRVSFLNNQPNIIFMKTITLPKKHSELDLSLLQQLKESLKDIKEGRIKRVK